MSGNNSGQVQFSPVETGSLADIPADMPAGEWTATCGVTKKVTSTGFPMLSLAWKTSAAADDVNEDFVGKKVFDNLIFFPKGHGGERMGKQRLKDICTALDIEIPAITKLSSWDDISELVEALDGAQSQIFTYHEVDKKNGGTNTRVRYTAPGASYGMPAATKDDDEDEAPAPKAKNGAKAKKR